MNLSDTKYLCECNDKDKPHKTSASNDEWEKARMAGLKLMGNRQFTIINKDCPNTDKNKIDIIFVTEHLLIYKDI